MLYFIHYSGVTHLCCYIVRCLDTLCDWMGNLSPDNNTVKLQELNMLYRVNIFMYPTGAIVVLKYTSFHYGALWLLDL